MSFFGNRRTAASSAQLQETRVTEDLSPLWLVQATCDNITLDPSDETRVSLRGSQTRCDWSRRPVTSDCRNTASAGQNIIRVVSTTLMKSSDVGNAGQSKTYGLTHTVEQQRVTCLLFCSKQSPGGLQNTRKANKSTAFTIQSHICTGPTSVWKFNKKTKSSRPAP